MLTEFWHQRDAVERRAWISAGAPILALVLVVAGIFFGVIASFAHRQDRAFAEESSHLLESVLNSRADSVSRLTLDYAMWNDAYQHVTRDWRQAWIDDNYYTSVADVLLVLRADGSIRHKWIADGVLDGEALINGAVRASRTDLTLPQADSVTSDDLVTHTLIAQNGRVALVSIAAIALETPYERRTQTALDTNYLAIVDVLTPGEIAQLGETLGLERLTFTQAPRVGADVLALPLHTPTGRDVGMLTWVNERPGSATFSLQFWPIMLGLIVIGALATIVARRLVATQIRLSANATAAIDSNQQRAEFIATVSHELRTPLNAIVGYTEHIQDQLDTIDNATTLRPDTNRILVAAKQLRQLINDVLDHARIDAGRIEFCIDPISVEDILEDVLQATEPAALMRNNVLSITDPGRDLYVLADDVRLRQILLCLLNNAIKFTQDGEIEISARIIQSVQSPRIEFNVRDTGIGIAPDELPQLFRPFAQANAEVQKRYGGLGLGLSMSRKLARAMGGSLTATSTLGKGSTFTLTLRPAKTPARVAA